MRTHTDTDCDTAALLNESTGLEPVALLCSTVLSSPLARLRVVSRFVASCVRWRAIRQYCIRERRQVASGMGPFGGFDAKTKNIWNQFCNKILGCISERRNVSRLSDPQ